MNYPYSEISRLENPLNYMYTPFQGESLLRSYLSSRIAVVRRCPAVKYANDGSDTVLLSYALPRLKELFDAASIVGGMKFQSLLEAGSVRIGRQDAIDDTVLQGLARIMDGMSTLVRVTTVDLLHSHIALQLTNAQDVNTKIWLDRLVQRFEVTKKIYEFYQPGFRRGVGDNSSVRLYWLFAFALCLFYANSKEIKYLSTLLKVCDLLCSLSCDLLQEAIPENGLSVVLAAEIVSVQLLAGANGISLDTE